MPALPKRPGRSGARDAALEVLLRVSRDGAYAAAALEATLPRSGLDERDRALATELVYGALRWRGALDLRLAEVSSRPLDRLDRVLLEALRIGSFQLLGPSRAPAHAAVDEAVALVEARRGKVLAGYANAVLRRLAAAPVRPLDPIEALPRWIAEAVESSVGVEAAARFARATTEQPWTGLRVEAAPSQRVAVLERLGREAPGASLRAGKLSPLAVLARGLGPLASLAAYREGLVTVQDEGAQAAALLLDLASGQAVLDACAGRGGKTGLLARLGAGRVRLDAADRSPRKLERLRAELDRIGLAGAARPVAVDLEEGVGELEPPYDRILVDAPCSGTGTLARRPEIRHRVAPADVERLVRAQERILERCAGLLAPEGALVYCVCSVLPAEGSEQVRRLLETGPGRGLVLASELALWPHEDETDGFYAARLARAG